MPTKFQLLPQDITERLKGLSEKVAGVGGARCPLVVWFFCPK
jgi:hypothetical protein